MFSVIFTVPIMCKPNTKCIFISQRLFCFIQILLKKRWILATQCEDDMYNWMSMLLQTSSTSIICISTCTVYTVDVDMFAYSASWTVDTFSFIPVWTYIVTGLNPLKLLFNSLYPSMCCLRMWYKLGKNFKTSIRVYKTDAHIYS